MAHHQPRRRRVQLFAGLRMWGLDIIRAEGAFGSRDLCRKKELSSGRGTLEFVAEMLEVFRADFELQNFLDHRREVSQ